MDNGRSHIETNEGNLLKKKKKASTPSFISPTPTGEGNGHYDVFLSFRGLDTRKGFADHLYHSLDKAGIVPVFVFRDDKSIPIGEEFDSRILDAIARSKISILIISENYASSKWCLRELIHIMDHRKRTSHIVLPIFYKVNPSDVRRLKGSFGKAFHQHKKYFDEEVIQKGPQALEEVSYLHGWESEKVTNGHEGELVKKVIENVQSKLRQDFQLDVTEHLVGIDDHVNKIRKWVDTPTTNARMIGIYGMGGIGKTTLAKVIYNQLSNDFVHRSFLADIRETACRNNIVHLQKQLIRDILQIEPQFGNVDDGISLSKSRFKGKNVLILLDDIDHEDQLNALARERNWFMAGSIIIVTTRYEAILDQSKFNVHKYDLNELDQKHALLLFNRHAFYMDHSLKDFEGLSRDIVSTMGGLPLALKVVGSYLYKKPNRKVWKEVQKQLKSQPHRDVQKILQISYDALEDGHKQIFLDIACFFIGKTSKYAMYMWEDYGFYPNQGIEELKLRCLIKIGGDGEFMMHDQLRDLGRRISYQGQSFEKHSGPWDYNGVSRIPTARKIAIDKGQSQDKRKRAEEENTKEASTSSFNSLEAMGVGSGQYDVFLSFRGLDTRKAFTDHLGHSLSKVGIVPICVFRDDNSIPVGEEFSSKILDAITQAKISILIISENYASSKWCLRELIHIMDRKKSVSHIVLPIFYKVAPSDVRYLTGNFGNAFRLSQAHFEEKDIQEGQRALNEVSYLNGWESEKFANGYEGKLIEHVVETVMSKLQEDFQLDVPKQLVGLDGCMKEIMTWIDNPSINARMIGIYGMGGIGKTTLAKCIYNQLSNKFVHFSFLPDIRETTRHHGITYLQSQLISDILDGKNKVSRTDDGINIIKSRFRRKKVLILLDDIDDKNQLNALVRERNWFMPGSLIIVTTRNEAILDQSEFEVDYKYELSELNDVQAFVLFNRHAFHTDRSSRDFEGLSHDIISTMGGLPLAIEVVGSYLYKKKDPKLWEDVRKQLENQPHRDVQKILRISYDALEDGHKQIFLDVVCFFIGEDSNFAMYMWEDCGFYPSQGVEELKLRCLVKIGDDGKFKMHDQLRDLGRSIFCQGQPLEKCGRPWDHDYKGVPKILRSYGMIRRFHDLMQPALSRDHYKLLSKVRWLWWRVNGSNLSLSMTNLHLPKLLMLDLVCNQIRKDWQERRSFMASKRLKVLDLCGCRNLRRTPDLSAFTQLKDLILSFCHDLEHLHPSIGKLASLVSLDLYGCENLKELPKEVGELKNLEELELGSSGITEIPTSIGSLRKLKKLSAGFCCSLREIPSSIWDLQNLQHLDLISTGIEKLPSAVGRLKNLWTLNLYECRSLKGAILSEISDLPSLKDLDLSFTLISDLPSVWNLSSLRRLGLSSCPNLRSLLELPSSLQCLDLRNCYKLQSLLELPSSLQDLDLGGCYNLRSLPELPLGLTCLSVTYQSLGLPQLLRLIHLKKLDLEVHHLLEDIRELSSITLKLCFEEWDKLTSLSLSGLTHLEELSIKKCSSIRTLGLSGFIHLKRLRIEHCDSLVEIKGCDNLESLEVIFLYFCKCLKKFKASGCGNLIEIQGLDGAKSLEELDFTGCKSMENLPDLTGCEKLRSLRVQDCKKLAHLQGLEKLNLIDLDISGCDSLEAIPNLSGTHVFRNYEQELSFDSWSDVS